MLICVTYVSIFGAKILNPPLKTYYAKANHFFGLFSHIFLSSNPTHHYDVVKSHRKFISIMVFYFKYIWPKMSRLGYLPSCSYMILWKKLCFMFTKSQSSGQHDSSIEKNAISSTNVPYAQNKKVTFSLHWMKFLPNKRWSFSSTWNDLFVFSLFWLKVVPTRVMY